MKKNNVLKKYLAYNGQVLVIYVDATDLVKIARNTHNLSNVATAALGRTLVMTAIISSTLKEKTDKLTVNIRGDGYLGNIITCGNSDLKLKGYVTNPEVELPLNELGKLDVAKALGKGTLTVIQDIGLKEPYIGNSNLVTSEIAEDFAYYYATSCQKPCVISLGVNLVDNEVSKACGYMIEPLPNCEEKVIDILETINSNISSVTNLSSDLGEELEIAKFITGDNNIEEILSATPSYECDCSKERIDKAIITLGKKEALETLENNNGNLEVACHFCNKKYNYSKEDIERLFN